MILSSLTHMPSASRRIRSFAVLLSAVAISLTATGCGPSRAAPAYQLKTG